MERFLFGSMIVSPTCFGGRRTRARALAHITPAVTPRATIQVAELSFLGRWGNLGRRYNVSSYTVADSDLELGGGVTGFDLLALLAILPSIIYSFFTQTKAGGLGPSPKSATDMNMSALLTWSTPLGMVSVTKCLD